MPETAAIKSGRGRRSSWNGTRGRPEREVPNGREIGQARIPWGGRRTRAGGAGRAFGAERGGRGDAGEDDAVQEGGDRAVRLQRREPAPEFLAAAGDGGPGFLPRGIERRHPARVSRGGRNGRCSGARAGRLVQSELEHGIRTVAAVDGAHAEIGRAHV